jgi:YVTN family beta-propeller protein
MNFSPQGEAVKPVPKKSLFAIVALVAGLSIGAHPDDPVRHAVHYAVQQRWDLGPASHWDYLAIDQQRKRLFVTRGDHVQVLDLASGKPVGEISRTDGVHGVAFAPDLKLGFTSNGRAGSVTVFDLDTLQVKGEWKVAGANPDAILYDPATRKLYTFNGKSGDVSVFDAASGKPLATIPVGGKPEFAVTDGKRIYVNIEDKAEIVAIDAGADRVLAHWPLAGCEEPSGLALDSAHARLFSVCANRTMMVTDAAGGKQVARITIGEHPDAAVYDAASATVFSSNGEGTLSVVRQLDADHYAPAVAVPTLKGARTMAYDGASRRAFLPTVADQHFTMLVVGP